MKVKPNTVTLEDKKYTHRNGCYRYIHTLKTVYNNGLYYGHSKCDYGYQCENTFYGIEMSSCSNLDLRSDGFSSHEAAMQHLIDRFNVLAIDTRGNAVTRKKN